MISVEEARTRILEKFSLLPAEQVMLDRALGRTLAEDVAARRTQPPKAVSAMDGYAVLASDIATVPVTLRVVGEIAAGGALDQVLAPGETARIFTGAPLPEGADCIVIQEDTEADEDAGTVLIRETAPKGHYVRPAGLDFQEGDILLPAGTTLTARDIGIAAAMNRPWLTVRRRPRVAILATGDEIAMPGDPLGENQIVSSNGPALAAAVTALGGEATLLGIAKDDTDGIARLAEGARGADLLLTTGGASVGKHDLIGKALSEIGLQLDFWRIAMRPGKPLMFGSIGDTPVLSLPGNPVSTLVCFLLFAAPALAKMQGIEDLPPKTARARLGNALPENDRRQDYLRASLTVGEDGAQVASPYQRQDSSMMSRLAASDCLIIRPPHAPPASEGDWVEILLFPSSGITY